MNVTAFIAIVSKAHAHILRLSKAQAHHLVVSERAARAVLLIWRLQRRVEGVLAPIGGRLPRPSVTMVGHSLVLGLGFLLVATALSGPRPTQAVAAAQGAGQLLWSAAVSGGTAADVHDVTPPERLEVGQLATPAPTVAPATPPPAPAAPRATAKPAAPPAPAAFTPPPGSGGDGLAAIYAVFGNSPGLSWALRVANCESHYNPLAVNRSSGASGLFQFMPSTWNANFPGQNIWDPYAQARGALVFYNAGRQSAWTCK